MTLCAYHVDCADVLDLTDPATCAPRSIEAGDLAGAWADLSDRGLPVPSWHITDRLKADGVAAIVVPSFAAGALRGRDVNLEVWTWDRAPPHRVQVIDDHGCLPRDASSWRSTAVPS